MSDGYIDGDELSEFAMKGGIAMNFRIFYLLNPDNLELTSEWEDTSLIFVHIGKVTSSEF